MNTTISFTDDELSVIRTALLQYWGRTDAKSAEPGYDDEQRAIIVGRARFIDALIDRITEERAEARRMLAAPGAVK